MNIGLYFGSFNPVHNGHLIIANYVINNTDVQQLWMVVSPQNPLKKTNTLLNGKSVFLELAAQPSFIKEANKQGNLLL